MPAVAVDVPIAQPRFAVSLYYLGTLPPYGHALEYLQYVRQPERLKIIENATIHDYGSEYLELLPELTLDLIALVSEAVKPDAIAGVPSSRTLVKPYLEACRGRFIEAEDLTPRFTRHGTARATESRSFEEILDSIVYQGPRLGHVHSVLIVDDLLASGSTVAAMITRLRNAGMPVDAKVSAAVPLRVLSSS